MATHYLIKGETLIDIADAIREKTGNDSPIAAEDMAGEIENIPQGGAEGTIYISQNDTYNVAQYQYAAVNTDPAVGLIFEAPDSSALPTRLRVIGYTSIPDQFTGSYYGSYAGYLMANITELILPQTLTSIRRGGFVGMTSITSIYLPNVRSVTVAGFAKATALTKVEFGANSITQLYHAFGACASIKQMIFHGDISSNAWGSPFGGATPPVELYDFSHCTNVFTLSTTDHLPHASGCVIRVPAAKLTEWQNATNWNALTDVVWEGV